MRTAPVNGEDEDMTQPNFQGATNLQPKTGKQVYCPRCSRPGVQVTSGTHEIWNCQFGHGEILRKELAGPETAPGKFVLTEAHRTAVKEINNGIAALRFTAGDPKATEAEREDAKTSLELLLSQLDELEPQEPEPQEPELHELKDGESK